jgi:hypothetical protein
MLKSKTVFIIGAGASSEVGLPLGKNLALMIAGKMAVQWDGANLIDGDGRLVSQVASANDRESYLDAARQLRRGLPASDSIDEYLDVHRKHAAVVLLGKAAAVKCIVEAERRSNLFFAGGRADDSLQYEDIANTWYAQAARPHASSVEWSIA